MNLLTLVPSRRATCSAFRATSLSLAKYASVLSHVALEQAFANQLAGLFLLRAMFASSSSLSRCPSRMSFLYRLDLALTQKSLPVINTLISCGSSIEVLLVVFPTVFSIEASSLNCFCLKLAYFADKTAPVDGAFMPVYFLYDHSKLSLWARAGGRAFRFVGPALPRGAAGCRSSLFDFGQKEKPFSGLHVISLFVAKDIINRPLTSVKRFSDEPPA